METTPESSRIERDLAQTRARLDQVLRQLDQLTDRPGGATVRGDIEQLETDPARFLPDVTHEHLATARVGGELERLGRGWHGVALDLLLDPDIGIVSMGGRAGTGKSALDLCAGLEAVLEQQDQLFVVASRCGS